MTDKTPDSTLTPSDVRSPKEVTPLRCLIGSTISGSLAVAMYSLTYSIAHTFATKPLTSTKPIVLRIGSLVRTLVVGMASLGTFIFAFVAFGLILLAIQLTLRKIKST